MLSPDWTDNIHDALNRMKRAHERGTGCNLTAEMIQALGVTFLAERWDEMDPRKKPTHDRS